MPHRNHIATLRCGVSLITIHVSGCFGFSDINISQGSVVTRLRCGGTFYYRFSRNLSRSPSVKNFENQLSFGKVRDKNRVVPFFSGHGVLHYIHLTVFFDDNLGKLAPER